jgi:hypothetical protein
MTGVKDADDQRTLERLALATWSENADARVVAVTVVGDRAEVALLVADDYEYWVYFQRQAQSWHETVSGNGPTTGWENPSVMPWSTDV